MPPIIRALGSRLRLFSIEKNILDTSALKVLPHWENPKVKLMQSRFHAANCQIMIDESENFETFLKNKNHALHRLSSSVSSLLTSELPASALSFLPKSLTSLECNVAWFEPFSLQMASMALDQQWSRANVAATETDSLAYHQALGWLLLGWPTALKKLILNFPSIRLPLHFGCLPATLQELKIVVPLKFTFEGGDLAHMSHLEIFSIKWRHERLGARFYVSRWIASLVAFVYGAFYTHRDRSIRKSGGKNKIQKFEAAALGKYPKRCECASSFARDAHCTNCTHQRHRRVLERGTF